MTDNSRSLLNSFREQHLFDDMDIHFGLLMQRLSGESSVGLALAAALASNRTARGDICLELAEWGGRNLGKVSEGERFTLPDLATWEAHLATTSVVCRPGGYAPLVLDHQGKLYLYRYWEYQQQLADMLRQRAESPISDVDEEVLINGLALLFPDTNNGQTDWQKVAAATAVLQRLTVISGGLVQVKPVRWCVFWRCFYSRPGMKGSPSLLRHQPVKLQDDCRSLSRVQKRGCPWRAR